MVESNHLKSNHGEYRYIKTNLTERLAMKHNKRYTYKRLGELKKYSRDFRNERKKETGYERQIIGDIPILHAQHRCDHWLIRLRDKLKANYF